MYLMVESVYPNLEREMLKNDKTVNDLLNGLQYSNIEFFIQKLQDKMPVTVLEAQKIKKAIGSELPLEELFKREGD